eukprot:TRINITY_DN49363_c0_g1_i1.p1 TRINITY_DN49363_c0_g1~~TRINITY_DN49363_c0_g1_i1.p1  ORF type:complete len:391 (-),score=47.66 TRINITY_DN49363_c0_g1_i1:80-1153(-)
MPRGVQAEPRSKLLFFVVLLVCLRRSYGAPSDYRMHAQAGTDVDCWETDCIGRPCYTFELCCNSAWGSQGLSHCWSGYFSYERCCHFHPGGGNERFLPATNMNELNVVLGSTGNGKMRLRQNQSGSWIEIIPGLLWKQSYAMLRWLETMPDTFYKNRSFLELGSGIGLLSLYVARRGALVTATDGSEKALQASRINAAINLPSLAFWNQLTWRIVRWEAAQDLTDVRALGLTPPYAVLICSALLYVAIEQVWHLVRLMWLCTDESSEVLWGSGVVPGAALRWAVVLSCFEVVEETDAVAAGYTRVAETTVLRLRRRPLRRLLAADIATAQLVALASIPTGGTSELPDDTFVGPCHAE